MAIELVEAEEMRTGKGGGGKGKGQKYAKYKFAVRSILPFLKENVESKGTIRVRIVDLKEEMGKEFVSKHSTSIYWGLKHVLFQEGIWVTTGKHIDGSDMLVLRGATPDDKLPDSLQKGLIKETEKGKDSEGEKDKGNDKDLPDVDEDEDEDENEDEDEDEDEDENKDENEDEDKDKDER
jgi:hypothetical protein